MAAWIYATFLALVQGLTEFLPVSSSGHLVISGRILGGHEPGVVYSVLLHLATLFAIIVYYRRDLRLLAGDLGRVPGQLSELGFSVKAIGRAYAENDGLRMGWLVALGTIPALVSGILFNEHLEAAFMDTRAAGGFLLVTGVLLLATCRLRPGEKLLSGFTWWMALAIGVAQAAAMLPGISRSGATIVIALLLGLERELAVRYSLLLSIPAIIAANTWEIAANGLEFGVPLSSALVGMVVAFLVGLWALRFLVRMTCNGRLQYFADYCFGLGIGILLTVS